MQKTEAPGPILAVMRTPRSWRKRLLWASLLALLVLPALQAKWSFVAVRPLDGYFEVSPHAVFP